MKSKHTKRVLSEFEEILFQYSASIDMNYDEAVNKAAEYVNTFCEKKNIHAEEQKFLFESCLEIVQDWFPNVDGSFVIDF